MLEIKRFLKILCCLASVFITAEASPLELRLHLFGMRETEAVAELPIYFTATLSNPDAMRLLSKNREAHLYREHQRRENADHLTAAEWKKIEALYPTLPLPKVSLKEGALAQGKLALHSGARTYLLSFLLFEKLPSAPTISSEPLRFRLGVDRSEWKKIPLGVYQARYQLPGIAESNEVTLVIRGDNEISAETRARLEYQTGRYELLSGHFADVFDRIAPAYQQKYSSSALGWELQGDAAFAQHRFHESIQDFEIALEKAQKNSHRSDPHDEALTYYERRLREAHQAAENSR